MTTSIAPQGRRTSLTHSPRLTSTTMAFPLPVSQRWATSTVMAWSGRLIYPFSWRSGDHVQLRHLNVWVRLTLTTSLVPRI